ncbi:hypothetical protein AeRB84_011316 [Aphanomyces euteiches]|nr:hypothetical protein AeRB84_011316 [Aphanomyces euteiches]
MIGDTTVIKIYLLDKSLTQVTTFLLQTLTIMRPKRHLESSGGAAMWTTTSLKSLQLTGKGELICTDPAVYSISIGFDFPFENDNFVPVRLDHLVPQNGQWMAQITSTDEIIYFISTSGIYRRSPSIQAYMATVYWELPPNPIEFISKIQFVVSTRKKDMGGWFRWILCDGVGLNIMLIFGVALIVMVNIYRDHRILWIPDVYPSVQSRAALRAGLLLVDCVVNGWWYPYQWAINQSNARKLVGPVVLVDNARADGLMVVLAITYTLAITVRVRVQLAVVVIIFVACFYTRQFLTQSYGVLLSTVLVESRNKRQRQVQQLKAALEREVSEPQRM